LGRRRPGYLRSVCYEDLTGQASDAEPAKTEIADDDLYNIIYSSGTTGEPKGIVHGPALMPGHHKRPDLTSLAIVDGWLHTGDVGYADAEGFLCVVDRKRDMIISSGTNVFPKDIEEIVVQHPAVREAAVFGIPSEKWGETPLGAVILRQPGSVSAEKRFPVEQRARRCQESARPRGNNDGGLSSQCGRQNSQAHPS
jgi:acyl-CoA synthetase (AMP-forming)/AMP-acid ligase II